MITTLLLSALYNPSHIIVERQDYRECIVTEETNNSRFSNKRFGTKKEKKTKRIVCY